MATKAKWKMPDGEGGFYVIHHETAAEMVKYGSTTVKSFLDNLPVMSASTFMKTLMTKADAEAVRSYLKISREAFFDETGQRWSYSNARLSTVQSYFGESSAYFNGSAYLRRTSGITLGASDFTISCWVRTPSTISGMAILGWGDSTNRFGFSLNSSAIPYFYWTYNSSSDINTSSGSITVGASEWVHLEVDYRNSDRRVFFFINGVQPITSTLTATGLDTARSRTFYLGEHPTGASSSWTGYIDEFLVTNRVLHTANFTPPFATYTYNSTYDLALLHFE